MRRGVYVRECFFHVAVVAHFVVGDRDHVSVFLVDGTLVLVGSIEIVWCSAWVSVLKHVLIMWWVFVLVCSLMCSVSCVELVMVWKNFSVILCSKLVILFVGRWVKFLISA